RAQSHTPTARSRQSRARYRRMETQGGRQRLRRLGAAALPENGITRPGQGGREAQLASRRRLAPPRGLSAIWAGCTLVPSFCAELDLLRGHRGLHPARTQGELHATTLDGPTEDASDCTGITALLRPGYQPCLR